MTMQQLASAIAKREGKKHQASIGDIREILRIIVDLQWEYEDPLGTIQKAVDRRERSRKTKSKGRSKR